jgi:hypothetical protein
MATDEKKYDRDQAAKSAAKDKDQKESREPFLSTPGDLSAPDFNAPEGDTPLAFPSLPYLPTYDALPGVPALDAVGRFCRDYRPPDDAGQTREA